MERGERGRECVVCMRERERERGREREREREGEGEGERKLIHRIAPNISYHLFILHSPADVETVQ